MAFSTMMVWMFNRSMPKDETLLNCLSYYREGLNAAEAEIASQEVLSFFKVFEMGREGAQVRQWIADEFDVACKNIEPGYSKRFDEDRQGKSVEKYVYENCRVATAHASKKFQSGLVALTFRSLNSFMRPFVQMPRGFCHPAMSDGDADCRTH